MKLKRFNRNFKKAELIEYQKDIDNAIKTISDIHSNHINIQMDELGKFMENKGLKYSKEEKGNYINYFFLDEYTKLGILIRTQKENLEFTPKNKFIAKFGFVINEEFINFYNLKWNFLKNKQHELFKKIELYREDFTYNNTGTERTKNNLYSRLWAYDKEDAKELQEELSIYTDTSRFGL